MRGAEVSAFDPTDRELLAARTALTHAVQTLGPLSKEKLGLVALGWCTGAAISADEVGADRAIGSIRAMAFAYETWEWRPES